MSSSDPVRYVRVRRLFLRLLAVVYAIAFVSLAVQIVGLYGADGVLPLRPYLDALYDRYGAAAYWRFPSVFWALGVADATLVAVCVAGVAASAALFAGVAPTLTALACWATYLSLLSVGRVFLSFQWDILLVEAGFLAVLFAPRNLRPGAGCETPVSRIALALVRYLVFRLMFASGVVKLLSNDPSWWQLTALDFHYFTQPLPAWTSWYAHHLSADFGRASVAVMFFVELVVPFFVFGPRRLRLAAFAALVGLQVVIAATGNYTFFNLLTAVLCVTLLDDGALPRRGREPPAQAQADARPAVRSAMLAAVAALLVVVATAQMFGRFGYYDSMPWQLRETVRALAPLRLTSSYGLFSFMTKRRPEITIEGTTDGQKWKPYAFRYKPGDPAARPRFVAPHQPRLDWQMWFAALSNYRRHGWVVALQRKLLEGSGPVLALLADDPFDGERPLRVRATVADYRFTTPDERAKTGHWWVRGPSRPWSPELSR